MNHQFHQFSADYKVKNVELAYHHNVDNHQDITRTIYRQDLQATHWRYRSCNNKKKEMRGTIPISIVLVMTHIYLMASMAITSCVFSHFAPRCMLRTRSSRGSSLIQIYFRWSPHVVAISA